MSPFQPKEEQMARRITLVQIHHRKDDNINQELQWLGNSLGLFNLRDKDSSCFRIFITLVKHARRSDVLSSDEIAEKLHLTRGTVVHHLAKLMDAGIVIREHERYLLRAQALERLVQEIQRDVDVLFGDLKEIAKDIDERLG